MLTCKCVSACVHVCECLSAQTKHISDQMAPAKAEPQPEAVSGCVCVCVWQGDNGGLGHAHVCFTSHETTQIVGALHPPPLLLPSPSPLPLCASFLLCPADLHLIAAILFCLEWAWQTGDITK